MLEIFSKMSILKTEQLYFNGVYLLSGKWTYNKKSFTQFQNFINYKKLQKAKLFRSILPCPISIPTLWASIIFIACLRHGIQWQQQFIADLIIISIYWLNYCERIGMIISNILVVSLEIWRTWLFFSISSYIPCNVKNAMRVSAYITTTTKLFNSSHLNV